MLRRARDRRATEDLFLASMGIYVFNRDVLIDAARQHADRFRQAHHSRARSRTHRVFSYVFQGYWEDIGTIRAFFEANLDLTAELPRFNFFDMTRADLHAARACCRPRRSTARRSTTRSSPTAASSAAPTFHQSIVGVRSIIGAGSQLNRTDHAGQRLLRIRRVDRRARSGRHAPHRHRREHAHRERHHRQERPHRRQRASSRPPASPTTWTTRSTTSATASSSSRRTASCRMGR